MKEIAVLTGGDSAEYEISLQSAQVVLNNLNSKKYNGTIVHIKDGKWTAIIDGKHIHINKKNFTLELNSSIIRFDYVFMALHGPPAENGDLQLYFDNLNLPYSSCNSKVSALTFNKLKCNQKLSQLGFRCAKSLHVKKEDKIENKKINETIGLPCFIKPNQAGSSFGVSKVYTEDEITDAIQNALLHDNTVLIEQFIDGIEVSCGVGIIDDKITAFPITEIISKNDFFDFDAKYNGLSEEITPARISDSIRVKIKKITEKIYLKMNLKGICRVDFIIMNETPYIIEINTIPGLSEESIIPKQAKELGISLTQLFDNCIESTIK
ncbi:MAG: D-alanine--D-alanine ligase [Flavobacteriales bacterium]|nr:D-alanine--D-alanine ligase [Flavobacteriales bacterium]|tara:strand:- start:16422 stop:17390 length:969 start_codon:yes stop_codon:yes gene_type:complete